MFRIDSSTSLGLNSDCIASYCIGDLTRSHGLEVPELLPCGYLVGDNNVITVNLKGKNKNGGKKNPTIAFLPMFIFLFFFLQFHFKFSYLKSGLTTLIVWV